MVNQAGTGETMVAFFVGYTFEIFFVNVIIITNMIVEVIIDPISLIYQLNNNDVFCQHFSNSNLSVKLKPCDITII